jgi:hypothetical protein
MSQPTTRRGYFHRSSKSKKDNVRVFKPKMYALSTADTSFSYITHGDKIRTRYEYNDNGRLGLVSRLSYNDVEHDVEAHYLKPGNIEINSPEFDTTIIGTSVSCPIERDLKFESAREYCKQRYDKGFIIMNDNEPSIDLVYEDIAAEHSHLFTYIEGIRETFTRNSTGDLEYENETAILLYALSYNMRLLEDMINNYSLITMFRQSSDWPMTLANTYIQKMSSN